MSGGHITDIEIRTFRPFGDNERLKMPFDGNFQYIYGENGCGKTVLFRVIEQMLNMSLVHFKTLRNCGEVTLRTVNGEFLTYGFTEETIRSKRYWCDENFQTHTIKNESTGAAMVNRVNITYDYDGEWDSSGRKKKKKSDDVWTERKCWHITHVDCYDKKDMRIEDMARIVKNEEVGRMVCRLYNQIFKGAGGTLCYRGGKCIILPTVDCEGYGLEIEYLSFGCWKIYMYLCLICHSIVNNLETVFLLDDFEFVPTPMTVSHAILVLQSVCRAYPNIQIIVAGHYEFPLTVIHPTKQCLLAKKKK